MMVKYLLPILLCVIAVLTIGLNHIWHDRKGKRYRWTIRVLIFSIVVVAGLNILDTYSKEQDRVNLQNKVEQLTKKIEKLNRQVNTLKSEVATLENQNRMLAMFKRMLRFVVTDHNKLIEKYPEGYFLFATDRFGRSIPSGERAKSKFTLDWDDSEVKFVDESIVYLRLIQFDYHPRHISVENFDVILEREVGATAYGFIFDEIGLFIELLDIESDGIIYVIGFRRVGSVTNSRELKPIIKEYQKRLGLGPILRINTLDREYLKFKDLVITSGWESLE